MEVAEVAAVAQRTKNYSLIVSASAVGTNTSRTLGALNVTVNH